MMLTWIKPLVAIFIVVIVAAATVAMLPRRQVGQPAASVTANSFSPGSEVIVVLKEPQIVAKTELDWRAMASAIRDDDVQAIDSMAAATIPRVHFAPYPFRATLLRSGDDLTHLEASLFDVNGEPMIFRGYVATERAELSHLSADGLRAVREVQKAFKKGSP